MKQSVRSLAAEACLDVKTCVDRLRDCGIDAVKGKQILRDIDLIGARRVLHLPDDRTVVGECIVGEVPVPKDLEEVEIMIRILRPLRAKGKCSRNYTTPIENVYAHGVPGHQRGSAKVLVEQLIYTGCLDEKVSQGRRHVWLTEKGCAKLNELIDTLPKKTERSNGENHYG